MSALQTHIRDAVASGRPYLDPVINNALRKLPAPVCFLDFETINPAIPLYPGTRPYQAIPLQWSAHRLGANGAMRHVEYLHDGMDDPRQKFLRTLLEALGRKGACACTRRTKRLSSTN